jgi:two-component system LytT family response regulator
VIKTVIIDDEPLARQIIREFLNRHTDIKIVGDCQDAQEALACIERIRPELIFLDIQMPEINGFEMLEMAAEPIPHVIFSTAYDQYALKAFEVNAIDYLLKPYTQERFDTALERARCNILHQQSDNKKIVKLLQSLRPEKSHLERLLVKHAGKIIILNAGEIQWIEAMEDYINIHTEKETYLVLQSLNNMETRLDPDVFMRLHRSFIVNIQAVAVLVPWTNGRLKCRLKNGTELLISRPGARKLKGMIV